MKDVSTKLVNNRNNASSLMSVGVLSYKKANLTANVIPYIFGNGYGSLDGTVS